MRMGERGMYSNCSGMVKRKNIPSKSSTLRSKLPKRHAHTLQLIETWQKNQQQQGSLNWAKLLNHPLSKGLPSYMLILLFDPPEPEARFGPDSGSGSWLTYELCSGWLALFVCQLWAYVMALDTSKLVQYSLLCSRPTLWVAANPASWKIPPIWQIWLKNTLLSTKGQKNKCQWQNVESFSPVSF